MSYMFFHQNFMGNRLVMVPNLYNQYYMSKRIIFNSNMMEVISFEKNFKIPLQCMFYCQKSMINHNIMNMKTFLAECTPWPRCTSRRTWWWSTSSSKNFNHISVIHVLWLVFCTEFNYLVVLDLTCITINSMTQVNIEKYMVVEYVKIQVLKFLVGYRDETRSNWNFLGHLVCNMSKSSWKICILLISFHKFEPVVLHHDVVGNVHQCHGVESSSSKVQLYQIFEFYIKI